MMIESHCTWPKHLLLPTTTGWKICLDSSCATRAGDDAAARIFAVELDLHVALGVLFAVSEKALGDDGLGALPQTIFVLRTVESMPRICTVSIWMLAPSSR